MNAPKTPLSRIELVALLAMLNATVALSIDAMLPVLPQIGADISPADPGLAPLVIATFVLGMGFGTFFSGPLSDAYGRKPIAVGGAVIFVIAAIVCVFAPNIETLLIARAVQGMGASGPRVVVLALVRDLFSGRQMAKMVSQVLMVFLIVPVVAPSLGALIAWAFGWRAIFVAFGVFIITAISWLVLRQPETLPPERRRPFNFTALVQGTKEVLSTRQTVLGMVLQSFALAVLFAMLMSSQAIFEQIFDRGATFPFWFAAISIFSVSAPFVNSKIVERVGMRGVIKHAMILQTALTLAFLAVIWTTDPNGPGMFPLGLAWLGLLLWFTGFSIGNASAIALEPMGHMTGLAASITTALSTLFGALLSAPVAQAFDGTMRPIAIAVLVMSVLSLWAVLAVKDEVTEV